MSNYVEELCTIIQIAEWHNSPQEKLWEDRNLSPKEALNKMLLERQQKHSENHNG